MRKMGFTLSEVLIALTIIGVVAAISAPLVNNVIPDKNKAIVLKAHKTISDINSEILDDPTLYYRNNDSNPSSAIDIHDGEGFFSTLKTLDNKEYKGSSKYFSILIDKISPKNKTNNNNGTGTFLTSDGTYWDFKYLDFTIDVNGTSVPPNCSYNKTSCKKPDRFNFKVDLTSGRVDANDPLTKAYLKNPNKLNDRKKDFDAAAGDSTTYTIDSSNPFEKQPDSAQESSES